MQPNFSLALLCYDGTVELRKGLCSTFIIFAHFCEYIIQHPDFSWKSTIL